MKLAPHTLLKQLYWGVPLPLNLITQKDLPRTERNQRIRERYNNGETLDAIADDFGLTHQRVWQIVRGRNR